ncbi:MAG: arsenic efflux protein [Clostridia bacterium]|nr:arsenic efflux protein [Clostridia bacterium]
MELIETLLHSLEHPLVETLKMSPIIFLAYLFMEWLEHSGSEKLENTLKNSKRFGPLWASVLGLLPQCGFSGAVAGMYATGTVTVGTLLAVLLATSDEMLPVMLGAGISVFTVIAILVLKFIVGCVVGFTTDFILKKFGKTEEEHIHEFCEMEKCSCKDGIWISALKHTLRLLVIIYFVSALLHFAVELTPKDTLTSILNFPVISQVVAAIIGLIPNCAVSITLTQLYVDSALGISPLLCGLLTNGGVGLLVLFRVNRNLKNNLLITLTLLLTGLVFGSVAGLIL